jgi:hypothetical protein
MPGKKPSKQKRFWFSYRSRDNGQIYVHQYTPYGSRKDVVSDIHGNGGIPRAIVSEDTVNRKFGGSVDRYLEWLGNYSKSARRLGSSKWRKKGGSNHDR